jgi:hypothetical protein
MRASELKVGQDFKFPGQRKFRSISEIKEIKSSDRAQPEHIGKLLFYFDDGSQMLLFKEDELDIQETLSPARTKIKREPSRYEFETYLNSLYSKTMDNETALKHFIYLTVQNSASGRKITNEKLKIAIRTKQFGRLLRRYDPSRFESEYESDRIK